MIKILKVGLTLKKDGEVLLVLDGEMPSDCMVVFMDKDSYKELKKIAEVPK